MYIDIYQILRLICTYLNNNSLNTKICVDVKLKPLFSTETINNIYKHYIIISQIIIILII